MIVVTVTNCPPSLRGDLTKWLCEINTGVYVGRVSARVREELWKRICQHLKNGQATMVFNAANEQGMDFYTWNSTWKPVDLDGIKLMLHPLPGNPMNDSHENRVRSNAGLHIFLRKKAAKQNRFEALRNYTVVDLETTGLDPLQNEILEFGAVKVRKGEIIDRYEKLVHVSGNVSPVISQITGITTELAQQQGEPLKESLIEFLEFIEGEQLLFYNVPFDMGFLVQACGICDLPVPENPCIDVLKLAHKKLIGMPNYKLNTLAEHFGLEEQKHRALADCILTQQVFLKLNEIGS